MTTRYIQNRENVWVSVEIDDLAFHTDAETEQVRLLLTELYKKHVEYIHAPVVLPGHPASPKNRKKKVDTNGK